MPPEEVEFLGLVPSVHSFFYGQNADTGQQDRESLPDKASRGFEGFSMVEIKTVYDFGRKLGGGKL